MKNRPFHTRLGFAIAGIVEGWRRERSFRSHILFAEAALAALCILRPAPVWWAIVFLTIGLVLALELINAPWRRSSTISIPRFIRRSGSSRTWRRAGVLIMAINRPLPSPGCLRWTSLDSGAEGAVDRVHGPGDEAGFRASQIGDQARNLLGPAVALDRHESRA